MKVIIMRADAYHVPDPDLGRYGADFSCIIELLKKDFLERATTRGRFFNLELREPLLGIENIKNGIRYNYYGAMYDFRGTVDEFLKEFSAIAKMRLIVKLCPHCKECFTSPPSEWYKHILRHIEEGKERFREESFSYYFGPS